MREAARRFGVSLCTVGRWVERGKGKRVDRMDLHDRPSGCPTGFGKAAAKLEDLVLATRADLKANIELGEYGEAAVRRRLLELGVQDVPSLRTLGRIFERRGVLDALRRVRRPAPPPGWYLPDLAGRKVELDSFDIVEGLVIGKTVRAGAIDVEVLNAVSLHGGLVGSWPTRVVKAQFAADCILARWREIGLPLYVQFDNDNVFQGAHQWPDSFGRITRLCLSLGVSPVFAPPRETGFQAAIENYNGRWQAKVWARFEHASLSALQAQSARFIDALRRRSAARVEAAPTRRPFPGDWSLDLQRPLQGCMIFLCRTNERGEGHVLGHSYPVASSWVHRLVRAELDLTADRIDFSALRRRDPEHQPLLDTIAYLVPRKRFRE